MKHLHETSMQTDNLRGRVEQVEQDQSNIGVRFQDIISGAAVHQYIDPQLNDLRNLINVTDRKVSNLIAVTNQDSVKFNGFGFRRMEEANAWVEINLPNHKFWFDSGCLHGV
jgi:hypothetical protein